MKRLLLSKIEEPVSSEEKVFTFPLEGRQIKAHYPNLRKTYEGVVTKAFLDQHVGGTGHNMLFKYMRDGRDMQTIFTNYHLSTGAWWEYID